MVHTSHRNTAPNAHTSQPYHCGVIVLDCVCIYLITFLCTFLLQFDTGTIHQLVSSKFSTNNAYPKQINLCTFGKLVFRCKFKVKSFSFMAIFMRICRLNGTSDLQKQRGKINEENLSDVGRICTHDLEVCNELH